MFSIDIDIGGTFTDGFFSDGEKARTGKVLTTPHDITECFMSCIGLGAKLFDLDLAEFLRRTAVARVSTTVGTNLLVQKSGPRLGLIATKGCERNLYGKGRAAILDRYLPADLVAGVSEAVDDAGKVVAEVDQEELLAAVRRLIQSGARMIGVSFRNAWRNPHNELLVRRHVLGRYPVHYLRSVPMQLGTEVMHVADDHARTNSLVFNAYIHSDMARSLYRAEDQLRAAGYERPLLVVHANGGNARVAKTVALQTLHSGPAAAARGAAVLAQRLGLKKVVTTDMGGTSFDMAVIDKGQAPLTLMPRIDGIELATPMIEVESLGAGGGSIANVQDGTLAVGPRSAGSVPGPACYGKGGMEPTVTDANLILGFIDPDHFLGGNMRLDSNAARRAIERRVGRPLGVSAEEAAFEVRAAVNREMAGKLVARLHAKGYRIADFVLFSVGGCGPLHACALAEQAGIRGVVAFPFGSVFSAFGGNTTDVQHAYMRTLGIPLARAADVDAVLADFRDQARRDMTGEGFAAKDIEMQVEVEIGVGGFLRPVTVPGNRRRVKDLLHKAVAKGRSKAVIERVRLTASCAVQKWLPVKQEGTARRAPPPKKGRRKVFWESDKAAETPVYHRSALGSGHRIQGPAIVEGPDTNYVVAPNWTLDVAPHGHFVMTRSGAR